MIHFIQKDIFNLDVAAIVNPVNCVGVMGKGLALHFKNKFPQNFKVYNKACKENKVIVGRMFTTKEKNQYIINFPTKKHWKDKSKIEYISNGLDDLIQVIINNNINCIAIPKIGCGLGGLKWEIVKNLMIEKLQNVEGITIFILED